MIKGKASRSRFFKLNTPKRVGIVIKKCYPLRLSFTVHLHHSNGTSGHLKNVSFIADADCVRRPQFFVSAIFEDSQRSKLQTVIPLSHDQYQWPLKSSRLIQMCWRISVSPSRKHMIPQMPLSAATLTKTWKWERGPDRLSSYSRLQQKNSRIPQ